MLSQRVWEAFALNWLASSIQEVTILQQKEEVRSVGICTVNPADGHRLEDGQEQQAGPAAGVVIIDLKHVDPTLDRMEKSLHSIRENREGSQSPLSARPCTYRRDHDQSYQEADDADEEQQQLPAVAPPDQVGVEVGHRSHQSLQTHKLWGKGRVVVCT